MSWVPITVLTPRSARVDMGHWLILEVATTSRGSRFRCRCSCLWIGSPRRHEEDALYLGDDHIDRIYVALGGVGGVAGHEERTGEGREHLVGGDPAA